MLHLDPGEKLHRTIRKHWFIILRDEFLLFLILLLPFVLYQFSTSSLRIGAVEMNSFPFDPDPALLVFLGTTWVLLVWLRMFSVWMDYYLDLWVITDKRIVDVDQGGFFRREVSSFRMERVQDVTTEVKGIVATLLNFGDLHVQTAGESREFIIRGIGNPKRVKELILKELGRIVEKGDAVYSRR